MMKKILSFLVVPLILVAATPVLTFGANLPDSPGDGFNCDIFVPKDRDLSASEIYKNTICTSQKIAALYTWISDIVRILEQSPDVSLIKDKPVPAEPIRGIPTNSLKLCKYSIRACNEKEIFVTQEGWEGKEVYVIQDFLKAEGSFTYQQSTGYFGPITRDAVKTFQTKYSLPSTGVVDKPTLEKMQAASTQVAPSQKSQINNLKPCSLCQ